jgi:riboflavin biosynthesis pyrimidine reductase
VHASYESDGWICGRVTMEPFAGGVRPETDGDHVVAILSERVSDEYLAFLRARGVSYLLAGVGDVDLPLAMAKIGGRFGVKALMLEGGGRINGGMLAAGLIDEVSVLVAPAVDGRVGTPALFDVDSEGAAPRRLALEHVEQRPGGVLWLRYRVEPRSEAE